MPKVEKSQGETTRITCNLEKQLLHVHDDLKILLNCL